jgi:hypothetical protein
VGNASVLESSASPEAINSLKRSRTEIIDSIEDKKAQISRFGLDANDLKRKLTDVQQKISVIKNKKVQLESLERQMKRHKDSLKVVEQRTFLSEEEIQLELKEKISKNRNKQIAQLRKYIVSAHRIIVIF